MNSIAGSDIVDIISSCVAFSSVSIILFSKIELNIPQHPAIVANSTKKKLAILYGAKKYNINCVKLCDDGLNAVDRLIFIFCIL
jgi:hypothetical protein